MYGIDISSNQGFIDFAKVKAAGVEFIVIRSTTKNQNPDVRLAEYVKGCKENGIPFAFYKYMYALTTAAAKLEASKVIRALQNIGVGSSKDCIIYADVEDKKQFALSTKALSDIVKAFKEVVEAAGYTFGLYMSKSPYETGEVDAAMFDDEIWLARYPSSEERTLKQVPDDKYKPVVKNGRLAGWQYSSKGKVDGISGYVDLDVFYGKIRQPQVKPEYFKAPEFTLIESLNNIGVYSSFANRKKLAIANGITNYTGTAAQNMELLQLLNEGKLKKQA